LFDVAEEEARHGVPDVSHARGVVVARRHTRDGSPGRLIQRIRQAGVRRLPSQPAAARFAYAWKSTPGLGAEGRPRSSTYWRTAGVRLRPLPPMMVARRR